MSEEISRERLESRKKRRKSRINWIIVIKIFLYCMILIFSIWGWNRIVDTGYSYAKNYVDTSVEHVRQENAINIQRLEEKIDLLGSEMSLLKEAIENTDETISGSTSIQSNIDSRLQELDNQLQDLEKTLKILKEAP